jgi:hypothetical protein
MDDVYSDYSREACEFIIDYLEEIGENEIDLAFIRGTFNEYDTKEDAMIDLGYDELCDLERELAVFELENSVIVIDR